MGRIKTKTEKTRDLEYLRKNNELHVSTKIFLSLMLYMFIAQENELNFLCYMELISSVIWREGKKEKNKFCFLWSRKVVLSIPLFL